MLNRSNFVRLGATLTASAFGAAVAHAGIVGVIEIQAHSNGESSLPVVWQITEEDFENGVASWQTNEQIDFVTSGGNVLAMMNPADLNDPRFGSDFDPTPYQRSGFMYIEDPVVNLNFAVQANPFAATTFTITSALLTFPNITNGTGQASASFSVTDGSFDGFAQLTGATGGLPGAGPEFGAFIAQTNGLAAIRSGSTFADLHQVPVTVNTFAGTVSETDSTPITLIPGVISSMSTALRFTLSAGDLASGTTTFEVVPEPASLALLAVGLALVRRR